MPVSVCPAQRYLSLTCGDAVLEGQMRISEGGG
jgi:hypothetical protein